jgi:2'-hydroxyisoflavone reductase
MRILIIGGTAFVGRYIAQAAVDGGHEVTVLHRGKTGSDLFPKATHLIGDRDGDLSALADGNWDATIDVCAYFPRQVRSLAAALGRRGGRHVFVSSVSAYRVPLPWGYDESAPLADCADPDAEFVTFENYGGLKAECERAVGELYGPEALIIRPTYVVGPHDHSYRFTWWVDRLGRGGTVLAPGRPEDPIQVIDARDQGTWTIGLVERSVAGAFHAACPAPPFGFGQLLEAVAAEVAPAGTRLVWVDTDFLLAEGVDGQALPLWNAGDPNEANANSADPAAAFATGLAPRALRETVADIRAADRAPEGPPDGVGITADREAQLLARWADRTGG